MTDNAVMANRAEMPMLRTCPFDPPPGLMTAQQQGGVSRVRIWDGSEPWLVTGYKEVREVLAHPLISSDPDRGEFPFPNPGMQARRGGRKVMVNMDGAEHQKLRRMLTRDFMVSRARALRPKIQGIVDSLITKMLADNKPTDFVEAFALPLPSLVICELLGVPYEESDHLEELSRIQLSMHSTGEQAAAALRGMLEFLGKVVDDKIASPQDDMVSRLVVEQMRQGLLTRDELVDCCQLLYLAGHETTANQIALSTLLFLQNPHLLDQLRTTDDPAVIANAVEEMLRYNTILHLGVFRVAGEDFELAGHQIKAGDGVIVALNAANRDEAAFDAADQIDFARKARHHVAFGFGVHQCLGQPLAREELEVVYSTLFRRIPTLALAAPVSELEFKNSMVYGVRSLPITW